MPPVTPIPVSIGVPVYNGERYIRQALESLLDQSFKSIELVVSDNASSDGTEAICRDIASRDARVRYLRQPVNVGAAKNFKLVLDQASGEYFMWAAADDIRSADFVEVNYLFLRDHPEYVASTSPVRFEGKAFDPVRMGDASLEEHLARRVLDMFGSFLHANGRFYSLMRRSAIQACPVLEEDYLGSDWAVVLYLAKQGKIKRTDAGFTVLGRNGLSGGKNIFRVYRKGAFDFLFPFNRLAAFTWNLARTFSLVERIRLAAVLCYLNVYGFLSQFHVEYFRKDPNH